MRPEPPQKKKCTNITRNDESNLYQWLSAPSELSTPKALPTGVPNPAKNIMPSIAVGIKDFFFLLSRFCRAQEVNPELEGTCRRCWKPLVQLS